jgi:hypothetical protein
MSDIVKRRDQLPADFGDSLMKGIEQTRSTIGTAGGKAFMRMTRAGDFIYGPQNIDVQDGSHWAVNLASLEHGWICWGDGELLGQIMVDVRLPQPMRPPAIEGYSFEPQFGMNLACISGDDHGLEVIYKNNSLGFKKAFDQLLADIRARYLIDQQFYWPVIELHSSSYPHKKYNIIFEPIFKIVGWADAEGNLQTNKPRAVASPQAATPRKRAAVAVEPVSEPEAVSEPEVTEDAPAPAPVARQGQRRRPAAR